MAPRRPEIQVFFTAFVFFFLETALFHLLQFTHDHLESTLVISYALLGLAAGALGACLVGNGLNFPLLVLCFALSIVLAFISIVRFPGLVRLSPLLILPFFLGNMIITYFLKTENSNRIYFFDLAGATAGIFFSVLAIPFLKTENALLLCVAVMGSVGFLFSRRGGRGRVYRILFAGLCLVSLAALAAGLRWDFLAPEKIIAVGGRGLIKDCYRFKRRGLRYLVSRDSLVTRVSVFSFPADQEIRAYDGSTLTEEQWVCFNGDSNDRLSATPLSVYRNDPRIPFMYNAGGLQRNLFNPPPRVFIIGTSAEGIVKSVKLLTGDPELIEGAEINPAVVKLMRGKLYDLSGRAYEGVDVKTIDARAYLKHAEARYDIITLMNTYSEHNIGYFGEPDFIHTREALAEYFDHLGDGGFLLLEERDVSDRTRRAIFRLLNNFIAVLEARGAAQPERHFFIYNVNTDKAESRDTWYTFIVVGKTPLTGRDKAWFSGWIENRRRLEYELRQEESPDMDFTAAYHTRLEVLGGEGSDGDYARFLRAADRENFWGEEVRLTPTSDDNPYIFDVYVGREEIRRLLANLGALCAALAAALAVFLLVRSGGRAGRTVPFLLYFILLGLGYFIVEITLLKFYQSHTGSPTNSLIFVLAGLLLATGLGSRFSGTTPLRRSAWAFLGIALFAAYHIFAGRRLLDLLNPPVWAENLLITATVFPLGFCMGIPFPFGLENVKRIFGAVHVPVFVALNSLASAFAVVLGLTLCIALGFTAAALVGVGCYACALPALLLARR